MKVFAILIVALLVANEAFARHHPHRPSRPRYYDEYDVEDDDERRSIGGILQSCFKPNTIFKFCQAYAQPTCRNPYAQVNPGNCVTACFCRDGMVLEEASNQCVVQTSCPNRDNYSVSVG